MCRRFRQGASDADIVVPRISKVLCFEENKFNA